MDAKKYVSERIVNIMDYKKLIKGGERVAQNNKAD